MSRQKTDYLQPPYIVLRVQPSAAFAEFAWDKYVPCVVVLNCPYRYAAELRDLSRRVF